MYLARRRIAGRLHYSLRESYRSGADLLFRELFDLGSAPGRYIVYPGGNAFYIDPALEDALRERGVDPAPEELETVLGPSSHRRSGGSSNPSGAGRTFGGAAVRSRRPPCRPSRTPSTGAGCSF